MDTEPGTIESDGANYRSNWTRLFSVVTIASSLVGVFLEIRREPASEFPGITGFDALVLIGITVVPAFAVLSLAVQLVRGWSFKKIWWWPIVAIFSVVVVLFIPWNDTFGP